MLWTPWERFMKAVWAMLARCNNFLDRHGSSKDDVGTLCECRRNAVGTLCARCDWQIWYFRHIFWCPHSVLTDFLSAVQMVWNRNLVWQELKIAISSYTFKKSSKYSKSHAKVWNWYMNWCKFNYFFFRSLHSCICYPCTRTSGDFIMIHLMFERR